MRGRIIIVFPIWILHKDAYEGTLFTDCLQR